MNAWGALIERLSRPSPIDGPGTRLEDFPRGPLEDTFDVFVENAWADAEKKGPFKLLRVGLTQAAGRSLCGADRLRRHPGRAGTGWISTTLRAIGPLKIHTSSSAASKWIPYEFGRAKDRPLSARRTAGG